MSTPSASRFPQFPVLWRQIAIGPLLLGLAAPLLLVADANNAVPDLLIESAESEYGRKAMFRMERWRDLMLDLADEQDESEVIERVNDFFNAEIPYISDIKHWKVNDYWATPYESLGTYGGDCEDYVIAKFYSLLKLGIDPQKLRFNYVKALDYNLAHMVLTYYPQPDAMPLVLDNLKKSIEPADQRTDLKPVYSFNAIGLWLDQEKGRSKNIGTANKLSRWTNLRVRMSRLGMDI